MGNKSECSLCYREINRIKDLPKEAHDGVSGEYTDVNKTPRKKRQMYYWLHWHIWQIGANNALLKLVPRVSKEELEK